MRIVILVCQELVLSFSFSKQLDCNSMVFRRSNWSLLIEREVEGILQGSLQFAFLRELPVVLAVSGNCFKKKVPAGCKRIRKEREE